METNSTEELSRADKLQILKKRAELLQITEAEAVTPGSHIQGLVFRLSGEKYAIDATFVSEVIDVAEITPLPCTPPFLIGIINLRGKILSVIDISSFLNLPGSEQSKLNKVIILHHEDIELGILTDEIIGNEIIDLDILQKKLSTILDIPENILVGVSDENLIVIDINKLLLDERLIIDEAV